MHPRALQSGTIDIAFTRPVQPSDAATLRSEHFHSEPLNVVMLKSHPLAKKRRILIRELAKERFILNDRKHSPYGSDKVIALCAEAGFSPRIALRLESGPVSSRSSRWGRVWPYCRKVGVSRAGMKWCSFHSATVWHSTTS